MLTRSRGADVDDTIKVTQTSDPVGILRSTFVVSRLPTRDHKRVTGNERASHGWTVRADAGPWDARALCVHTEHHLGIRTLLLPLSLAIQPVSFSSQLQGCLLPARTADSARRELDDDIGAAFEPDARYREIQGRQDQKDPRLVSAAENNPHWRLDAERPGGVR